MQNQLLDVFRIPCKLELKMNLFICYVKERIGCNLYMDTYALIRHQNRIQQGNGVVLYIYIKDLPPCGLQSSKDKST